MSVSFSVKIESNKLNNKWTIVSSCIVAILVMFVKSFEIYFFIVETGCSLNLQTVIRSNLIF